MEKAILAALDRGRSPIDTEEFLDELRLLAETAGAEVLDRLVQKGKRPEAASLIGAGKVEELAELCARHQANLVIFLNDLRPMQERNLTEKLNLKVIDRQALILDIFAQRARTREGKLQVELAQLNYLLPRLTGYGIILSRLGGGIGTRGPGETKLETDRRHIHRKISTLKRELEHVRSHRELLRKSRHNKGFFSAALVGYTNAGKSTLFNALTRSSVFVEDKLFATLDPTVKKVNLPTGELLLLVDTVGVIRNLPHDLVAAFRATLEEVEEADLLIHVMDVSQSRWEEHAEVVRGVLEEMAVDNKPILHVMNKVDLLPDREKIDSFRERLHNSIPVSALRKEGFPELLLELHRLTALIESGGGEFSWNSNP
ncbi:MAG: GTPase HflX [bacterium]